MCLEPLKSSQAIQRSAIHRPNMLRGQPKRCLTITGVNMRPIPSMQHPPWVRLSQSGIYRVGKTCFREAVQLTKPEDSTVYVQCISVAIIGANKIEQGQCDNLVGFPKSSHLYSYHLKMELQIQPSSCVIVEEVYDHDHHDVNHIASQLTKLHYETGDMCWKTYLLCQHNA